MLSVVSDKAPAGCLPQFKYFEQTRLPAIIFIQTIQILMGNKFLPVEKIGNGTKQKSPVRGRFLLMGQ
jgi:hypothetical protein